METAHSQSTNPLYQKAEQQETQPQAEIAEQPPQPILNPEQEEKYGGLLKELRSGLFGLVETIQFQKINKIEKKPGEIPSLLIKIKEYLEEINKTKPFKERDLVELEKLAIEIFIVVIANSQIKKGTEGEIARKFAGNLFLSIKSWNVADKIVGEYKSLLNEFRIIGFGNNKNNKINKTKTSLEYLEGLYQNMIDQILNLQKENPEETYDELLEKLVTVLEQTVNDTAQNPE